MPTINPRIAITLPPYRYDLLKRMATLQGVSMASMVSELLEEFYPVLERVCVALEMAKKAQNSTRVGMREAADRAIEEMQPMLDASKGQLDIFLNAIEQQALSETLTQEMEQTINAKGSAAQGKRDEGALTSAAENLPKSESISPRVVTRGSGNKQHKPSKPAKASSGKGLVGIERRGSQK